jgi:hypothetical protein
MEKVLQKKYQKQLRQLSKQENEAERNKKLRKILHYRKDLPLARS